MNIDAVLRLLAVTLLWASCFPLITLGLDLAPHLAFAAMRAALAGLCLLVLGTLLRRPIPSGGRSWLLIALTALGATTLGFFGMFHAAEYVSPGVATVIANAQPLLTAILAHTLLAEKLSVTGGLGLVVGFAGIVAISSPGFVAAYESSYAVGIGYISIAAAGVAIGNITIKRLSGEADAIMAIGFQLVLGAVPLTLLSVLTEDLSSLAWSTEFVVILFLLSLFGTSLAFWLWFTALERVELTRANAFTFLVPLFGLAIGSAFFQERLSGIQAGGVLLILTGIMIVQRGGAVDRRRS